jgi:hypothetical protein
MLRLGPAEGGVKLSAARAMETSGKRSLAEFGKHDSCPTLRRAKDCYYLRNAAGLPHPAGVVREVIPKLTRVVLLASSKYERPIDFPASHN